MIDALGTVLKVGDIVSSAQRKNGIVSVTVGKVLILFPEEGKVQIDIVMRGSALYEAKIQKDNSSGRKQKVIANSIYKINLSDINW